MEQKKTLYNKEPFGLWEPKQYIEWNYKNTEQNRTKSKFPIYWNCDADRTYW